MVSGAVPDPVATEDITSLVVASEVSCGSDVSAESGWSQDIRSRQEHKVMIDFSRIGMEIHSGAGCEHATYFFSTTFGTLK